MSLASTGRAFVRAIRRGSVAVQSRRVLFGGVLATIAELAGPVLARCRPIVGTSSFRTRTRNVGRDAGRRFLVAGDLTKPVWAQRIDDASELGERFHSAGFPSHRSDSGTDLSMVDDVDAATLEAGLAGALGDRSDEWYTDRGGVTRIVGAPLDTAGSTDDRSFTVWRQYRTGRGRTTGRATAVRVTSPAHGRVEPSATPIPPIDVVVTWVDHSDDRWQADLDRHVHDELHGGAARHARFENNDEIRFALRSIWQYCGWARHIYLVTDRQRPSWLAETDLLSVVDHSEILPATALPTFNSHAIESGLHRIPGLAERFVYFNDDFFVGHPIEPSCLFGADGTRPQVFSIGRSVDAVPPDEVGQLAATRATSDLLARLTDFHATELLHHAPYANLRSAVDELEHRFPAEFDKVAHSRFRHPADLSVTASLGPWYTVALGRGEIAAPAIDYVSLGHPITRLQLRKIRHAPPAFWCANRTDRGQPGEHSKAVTAALSAMYPTPAPWERP